ncbi:MAG: PTS sugar transporter subunit IIA [Alphaproteobacteria bacterium]|jgi:PTS system mannose-specific IIA component|nr:PTS sugar transporter subunit IIA [Alphaproteobacteria bacterium]
MLGIVLVSHGNLSKEMLKVAEHVVGPQTGIECVSIFTEDDVEQKRHEILERTSAVDTGDGVVIVTDMFGGTPSNLALSIMEERNIEIISGMNLPMLIKLIRERSEPMNDAATAAQEAGRRYINIASHLLKLDS